MASREFFQHFLILRTASPLLVQTSTATLLSPSALREKVPG